MIDLIRHAQMTTTNQHHRSVMHIADPVCVDYLQNTYLDIETIQMSSRPLLFMP